MDWRACYAGCWLCKINGFELFLQEDKGYRVSVSGVFDRRLNATTFAEAEEEAIAVLVSVLRETLTYLERQHVGS